MSLLIFISGMFYACSTDSDFVTEQKQENIALRGNVFVKMEDHETGDNGNNGGAGGGGSCRPSEFDQLAGNSISGTLNGRSVPDFAAPTYAVPYYVDYVIQYEKNAQGNYVITKNISLPKTNCSGFGQRSIYSSNTNAYIANGRLFIVTNFTVSYTLTSTGSSSGFVTNNVNYSRTKFINLE